MPEPLEPPARAAARPRVPVHPVGHAALFTAFAEALAAMIARPQRRRRPRSAR